MAFDLGPASGADDEVLSTINTTPLVDVMLVLLIIFLITIPVVTLSVKVDLPRERHELRQTQPETVIVSVDVQGGLYWFDTPVTEAVLIDRLKAVSQRDPQPEVHLRGDLAAKYAPIGRVVQACQRAGIAKLSFITEPPPKG
jgi:biopolymer transport protein ExbD